jgi:hypothetical protein
MAPNTGQVFQKNPDVLYFFLREKPHVLINKAASSSCCRSLASEREIDSGAFSTGRCLSDFRMIITYLLGPFYCTGIAFDTLNVDQAVYSFDKRVLY